MTDTPDYTDLVIDCESLSLKHDAAVWQIGAVCGDKKILLTMNPTVYIHTDFKRFHVDPQTLEWQVANNLDNYGDAITVSPNFGAEYLLDCLNSFVQMLPVQPKAIWSRHPIDITWLTHMSGVTGRALPWKYWQCYDIATVAYLAGERLGKPPANAHNALADAEFDYQNLKRLKEKFNGLG